MGFTTGWPESRRSTPRLAGVGGRVRPAEAAGWFAATRISKKKPVLAGNMTGLQKRWPGRLVWMRRAVGSATAACFGLKLHARFRLPPGASSILQAWLARLTDFPGARSGQLLAGARRAPVAAQVFQRQLVFAPCSWWADQGLVGRGAGTSGIRGLPRPPEACTTLG